MDGWTADRELKVGNHGAASGSAVSRCLTELCVLSPSDGRVEMGERGTQHGRKRYLRTKYGGGSQPNEPILHTGSTAFVLMCISRLAGRFPHRHMHVSGMPIQFPFPALRGTPLISSACAGSLAAGNAPSLT